MRFSRETSTNPRDTMTSAMKRPTSNSGTFSWKALFRLPVFLFANVAIFLLIGVSTLRETYRGWTVEREISALEAQAEALEGRKLKLQSLTEELSSPDRVEFDARRRLGWKKEGERVVVLTGYEAATSTSTENPELLASVPDALPPSNLALWWKYFFELQPH
jgi:cell division protein FtsL